MFFNRMFENYFEYLFGGFIVEKFDLNSREICVSLRLYLFTSMGVRFCTVTDRYKISVFYFSPFKDV